MQPIVPSAVLQREAPFDDLRRVSVENGEHRLHFYGSHWYLVGDYRIRRLIEGSFENGFTYTMKFLECEDWTMAKVEVKKITVNISGSNYTASAESGRTIVDHKNAEIKLVFNSEDTRRLLPVAVGDEMRIFGTVVYEDSWALRASRNLIYNFSQVNDESTIAFAFSDEKILYANLNLLAIHSLYFKGLSKHLNELPTDETSGLPLLKLNDHPSCAFEGILRIVYPCVDVEPFMKNISEVLRLADYLCFDYVLIKYENWLAFDHENRFAGSMDKLVWGGRYGMASLVGRTINRMTEFSQVESLKKDPRFEDLSKEVMSQLIAKLLAINKGTAD